MKILPNILPLWSIYRSISSLKDLKIKVEEAKAAGDDALERKYILQATDRWGKDIARRFNITINIKGAENIPTEGPVLYVSNHQGYADIPVCLAVLNKIQMGFIAKESLIKIPVFGPWLLRIGSITIDRADARESLRAIDEGVNLIKRGYSLLIFPEGTRSKGGPVKEFKKGSLRLATKPGVPIVPITIDGTAAIYEETGCVKKNKRVSVTVHPAIPTAGLDRKQQNEMAAQVEETVRSGFLSKQ